MIHFRLLQDSRRPNRKRNSKTSPRMDSLDVNTP